MKDNPTFELYVGGMFASKTSKVILEAQNHVYRGRHILAYKPRIDDRYSKNEITTHSGMVALPAELVEHGEDIGKHLLGLNDIDPNKTTVLVDEVFMIPGIAEVLVWLYRNGFSILASSLDMSSALQPFEEVVKIMPWATRIERCSAVCSTCKSPANFTWRKPDAASDKILVGGVETYEARCAGCHPLFGVK